MARIFISYSTKDRAFVLELKPWLEGKGHLVWVDEHELHVGEPVQRTLEDQLRRCDTVLFVLSPDALSSRWFQHELSLAQRPRGFGRPSRRLIPLLLKSCEIPVGLAEARYADFREGRQKGWEELEQGLGRQSVKPSRRWAVGALGLLAAAGGLSWALNSSSPRASAPLEVPRASPPLPPEAVGGEQLAGIVFDEKHQPLAEVQVSLPELGQETRTNPSGHFLFQLPRPSPESIRIMARKAGHETYTGYASPGNTGHNFSMSETSP